MYKHTHSDMYAYICKTLFMHIHILANQYIKTSQVGNSCFLEVKPVLYLHCRIFVIIVRVQRILGRFLMRPQAAPPTNQVWVLRADSWA